ncbi:MAG: type II toxin-antitoxin system VapC family toxin [Acidobacteriota bacterium]
MIYVLDTNICRDLIENPRWLDYRRNDLAEDDQVCTTMISFGESVGGWLPKCRHAQTGHKRAEAYQNLYEAFVFYRRMICLPFDSAAAAIFDQLRPQKLKIGVNDVAIAAITLSVNGILITRNFADFERVPNLKFEDWAIQNPPV